jgi:hypothetical protein
VAELAPVPMIGAISIVLPGAVQERGHHGHLTSGR